MIVLPVKALACSKMNRHCESKYQLIQGSSFNRRGCSVDVACYKIGSRRDVMCSSTIGNQGQQPTQDEAEEAVRVLIRWAGDDPSREGLFDTPRRVVKAYKEYFSGYQQDPREVLRRTFEETEGYDEIIALCNIRFESHCEHHIAPIIGRAHVAYLPEARVVGISKLARVVEIYARRFQIQEKLTAQIANTINEILRPKGVAVVIEAVHQCMTSRGVHKPGTAMITSRMLGAFRMDSATRREFLEIISSSGISEKNA